MADQKLDPEQVRDAARAAADHKVTISVIHAPESLRYSIYELNTDKPPLTWYGHHLIAEWELNAAEPKEQRERAVDLINFIRRRARMCGVNPYVPPPSAAPKPAPGWTEPPADMDKKLLSWFTSPKKCDFPWPGETCEAGYEEITLERAIGPYLKGDTLPFAVYNWKNGELEVFDNPEKGVPSVTMLKRMICAMLLATLAAAVDDVVFLEHDGLRDPNYVQGPVCPGVMAAIRECQHPTPITLMFSNVYGDDIVIEARLLSKETGPIRIHIPANQRKDFTMQFNLTRGDWSVRGRKATDYGAWTFCGTLPMVRTAELECSMSLEELKLITTEREYGMSFEEFKLVTESTRAK